MRYLQVPSRFYIPTPSLPFRRRSPSKSGRPDQVTSGHPMHGALRRGARTSQARGFASKFYDILSQESSDIITWTESGQAFQVLDYTRFSEEILLKYFRHNKFSSFRRQLNLYGYRKVIKGPDAGAYMHPSFQRDRPDLLGDVKKGKVPHYDMHGVNEIHGQHFRHHPPGAMKDPSSRDTMQSAPVTPELHGEGLGMQPVAGHGAMPVAHNTPGTEAAVALSNMSLEGMPPSTGWAQQHTQSMDALTLTPAWGGPHDSIAETGPPRSISESAGVGGRVSVSGGTRGSMSTGAPVAYWHKPRKSRTMSSQLVFSTQPAKDTLEILQPDPNLCDVMDVICQCMEVRSSTEGSEESNLSQLSACSFKKDSHLGTGSFKKDSHLGTGSFKRDSSRRSSISDLLNSISWESAMRGSLLARNSLAGAAEAAISEAEQETHSRSGHTNRTNSSNSSSTHSNRSITVNTTRPGMKQWPSFDPARELGGGNSATVTSMAQPAVVSLSPLGQQPLQQQLEQGQKQPQRGRPSFDPNSESAMAASLRAPGNARRQAAERAAKAAAVEPTHEVAIGGGNMPHGTPNTMARETSRESTTARIFNAAAARPAAATAGTTAASAAAGVGGIGGSGGVGSGGGGVGVGAGVGGVGDGVSGVGGGVWEMSGGGVQTSQSWGSRKDSAETCSVTSARTSTTSVTTSTTSTAVHWDASLQAHPVQLTAAAASAGPSAVTTASTWGLETELLQVGEGLSPQVSMSPPTSSVTSSPTSPADTEAFTRPALGRMSSLMWLTEPTPSRRPTIHESNEVDRLLANTEKFAAWTRVTDDPDSMLVAKSISDYLG